MTAKAKRSTAETVVALAEIVSLLRTAEARLTRIGFIFDAAEVADTISSLSIVGLLLADSLDAPKQESGPETLQ